MRWVTWRRKSQFFYKILKKYSVWHKSILFICLTKYLPAPNNGPTGLNALKSVFPFDWKWHFTLTPHSNYITLFIPFWNQFSNCNYLVDDWTYVCICARTQIHHHPLPPRPQTMLSSQYINWAITLLFQLVRIIASCCISPWNNVNGPVIRFMNRIAAGFSATISLQIC